MFDEKMLNNMSKEDLVKLVMSLQKDALTGVYKREVMDNIKKDSYVVAMIDINDLKIVNDSYGHDAGDDYIRSVASDIVRSVRASDMVIRYGGDEFLVVFDDCTTEQAVAAMQRITSAAVGVGIGSTLNSAIKHADRAMYKKKKKEKAIN